MNYGLLNLGSLFLGLAAWGIPLGYLRHVAVGGKKAGWPAAVSLGCCTVSLWFQICYNHYLVEIQDWSAQLDTSGGVVKVSAFLLVTTLLLNAAALLAERKKREGT